MKMERKHLFTAKSRGGWCTVISIDCGGRVQMDAGSGGVVTLEIKDIRKIVREYNKARKGGSYD
jgi:hypothetical protein